MAKNDTSVMKQLSDRLRMSKGLPISLDDLTEGLRGCSVAIDTLLARGDLVPDVSGEGNRLSSGFVKVKYYRYTRISAKPATPFSILGV